MSAREPGCVICDGPGDYKLWIGDQQFPNFLCYGCMAALTNFHEARDRGCTKTERAS